MSEEEYQIIVCLHRDGNGVLDGKVTRYRVPTKQLNEFWEELHLDHMGIEEQYPYAFNENILKEALDSPLIDFFEGEPIDEESKKDTL